VERRRQPAAVKPNRSLGSRLIVEFVSAFPARPWVFVTGRLLGDPLVIGAAGFIRYGDRPQVAATIRTIEFHSRPGTTTVAIDLELRDSIGPGAELVFPARTGKKQPDRRRGPHKWAGSRAIVAGSMPQLPASCAGYRGASGLAG
jgi:hypothetical protein